ncbi:MULTISPECIES: ATP-dependent DNA helicase RecQ [unclassified Polaribacter]|uniref:RecQ family ATP-dependent DNA helicase n=1 Tax=unclassified Polaribacter TaxID=196858 RepID=UPI0011BDB3D0|nr:MULTISPECIES: ATP-dependent DNA helicase RecQ [unclassified Polaribacter]TXD50396.1 RecQ family ATP-dependent DNA helicase [Polaribacter sp. IC063]TXD57360.1 RecQ family ATP-dependent DNA helicase [Polaribacter sp. IC066]
MNSAKNILKEYWNYDSFREPQEAIIDAVLQQKDVITLLPTGGGKSICFQVPALVKDGVCLVISPLIALMQDQVENLKSRNIKATTIKSGATQDEMIALFDTIKFGKYKFLYISPERLQSLFIQQKLKELNVSLVAIDEAHCISEWGHDFRPSYRSIKILKELIPDVNFIALTATANKKVLHDIAINLDLNEPEIFRKSFFRENLAYQVFNVEDKLLRLQQIFVKTKSPAIVYVSSRKKTAEIARFLNANNFKSSFYHGGLSAIEKQHAYENWMTEKTPIIVATNAFGMGIDKPNVGVVIHFDLPFSLENYIQESGRAGRNENKSFAVLLKNENDIAVYAQQLKKGLPSLAEVKEIHRKLYQYFRIVKGEILEEMLQLQVSEFCKIYQFSQKKVGTVLNILANNGVIEMANTFNQKSTIIFDKSSKTVISYAINNIDTKNFINSLLRTYTGLFQQEVKVDEFLLAKKNNCTSRQVIANLERLHTDKILIYHRVHTDIEIKFLVPREDDRTINVFSREIVQFLKQKEKKSVAFLAYIQNDTTCRSIQILGYFDEKSTKKCGICDVCLAEKRAKPLDVSLMILSILKQNTSLSSQEINQQLQANEKDILIHLRSLLSDHKIQINYQNKYQLKQK